MPDHERTEPSFSKTALMAALVIPALTVSLVWAGPQRDQYLWEQMQQHNFDLAAGGTLRRKKVLAPIGIGARDPADWDQGLGVISGFIDELEEMD